VPSRDQPQTALDKARHAIPQQGRKRKHQPRCLSRPSTHAHMLVIGIANRYPCHVLEDPKK
jgi:hypothetical protein